MRKHTPHGRRPLPEHIPVERIVLEPKNVEGLEKIGEEVSETLEWRSASYVRIEIVRPKYARFKSDGGTEVLVADMQAGRARSVRPGADGAHGHR